MTPEQHEELLEEVRGVADQYSRMTQRQREQFREQLREDIREIVREEVRAAPKPYTLGQFLSHLLNTGVFLIAVFFLVAWLTRP